MSPSRPDFDLDGDVYRRRIAITTVEPGVVVSDLEDDFHHFVITLRHDGRHVESVDAESERWPWSTCPAAAEPLRKLGEHAARPALHRRRRAGPIPKQNCTHQFDAACYAITHAAAGRDRARVRHRGPRARPGDRRDARAACGSTATLGPRVGHRLARHRRAGRRSTPRRGRAASCAGPTARSTRGRGRTRDHACGAAATSAWAAAWTSTRSRSPTSSRRNMAGVCHTMQPGVVEVALRHVGSIRDFAAHPERLARHTRP